MWWHKGSHVLFHKHLNHLQLKLPLFTTHLIINFHMPLLRLHSFLLQWHHHLITTLCIVIIFSVGLFVASLLPRFHFLDLLPMPDGFVPLPEGCVLLLFGCNSLPDGFVSPISIFTWVLLLEVWLGQDCELLVLWSDQTCYGFYHQDQYVAGFPLQLAVLLNALAQGCCLVHWKIPIWGTALHLSSLFYQRLSYTPLQLLDLVPTLFQRPQVSSFTKAISNFVINQAVSPVPFQLLLNNIFAS